MKVFHRTDHADEIISSGFKDGTSTYMSSEEHSGVWVSNIPLDLCSGAFGDTLLSLEIPEELFKQYEWEEEGKPYQESLIPASELNRFAYTLVAEEEDDEPLPYPPPVSYPEEE